MRSLFKWASTALLASQAAGLTVDVEDPAQIKDATSTIAYGMMKYYTGNNTGDVPGNLPDPYYWWEAGAMFMNMIEYWFCESGHPYCKCITDLLTTFTMQTPETQHTTTWSSKPSPIKPGKRAWKASSHQTKVKPKATTTRSSGHSPPWTPPSSTSLPQPETTHPHGPPWPNQSSTANPTAGTTTAAAAFDGKCSLSTTATTTRTSPPTAASSSSARSWPATPATPLLSIRSRSNGSGSATRSSTNPTTSRSTTVPTSATTAQCQTPSSGHTTTASTSPD